MSTARFVNSVFREIDRSIKQAEKDRIRREKEYIREQNRLARERVKQEKAEERELIKLTKEQERRYKESVKREWDEGKIECERRNKDRNRVRLMYIK